MAARSPGSTFLDFGDPLGGLGQTLMQLAIQRQQLDLQKERLALEKQTAKQREDQEKRVAEQQAFTNAQTQAPQRVAMQQMKNDATTNVFSPVGAAAMGVGGIAPTQAATPALQQFMQASQNGLTPDQMLAMAPALQEARKTEVALARLKKSLPEKAYAKLENVINLQQTAPDLPPDMLASIAGDELAALNLEKAQLELTTMKDVRAQDAKAQADLKRIYGYDMPRVGASKTLADMHAQTRDFGQQTALQDARLRAEAMSNARTRFEASPVTKTAQVMASNVPKLRELAVSNTAQASDALVFTFQKILDEDSAVRDPEYARTRSQGTLDERVRSYIGQWTKGTGLTAAQRDKIVDVGEMIAASHLAPFDNYYEYTRTNAAKARINPDDVTYDPYKDLREDFKDLQLNQRIRAQERRARGGR